MEVLHLGPALESSLLPIDCLDTWHSFPLSMSWEDWARFEIAHGSLKNKK